MRHKYAPMQGLVAILEVLCLGQLQMENACMLPSTKGPTRKFFQRSPSLAACPSLSISTLNFQCAFQIPCHKLTIDNEKWHLASYVLGSTADALYYNGCI